MNVVVIAVIVSVVGAKGQADVVNADPDCEELYKDVQRISAMAPCNETCNYDQGNINAAEALGKVGPMGCQDSYGANGKARVATLSSFLLSTPFWPNSPLRAAMVASLGNISKADGFKALLALVKESEDVTPTETTSTPVWSYIGQVGKDTGLLDLAAQALIRAEDRGGYGGQRQNTVYGLVELAKHSSNFDQWRPSIACLKRAACDRYSDVKYVATSGLQDLDQFTPNVSSSGDCYPCGEKAAVGTACYAQTFWAMSTGIKRRPDWYPDLNASSPFEEFQRYLYYLPKCDNRTNPPCYAGADPCPTECPHATANVVVV